VPSLSSVRRLTVFVGLSAVLLLLPCAPVLAHAQLLQTEPEDGAVLTQPPDQVRLRFSEPIEAEFNPVKVLDQQSERVDEGNARVDPEDRKAVVADLKELAKGTYTVQWRVISADTHPVNGSYEFSVTGAGTNEAQGATEAVVGSEGQSSDQAEPGLEAQQDTSGWSAYLGRIVGLGLGALVAGHLVHFVGLGIGALILLVFALRRK
jgi:methionine-rich copper-binding protein CopC